MERGLGHIPRPTTIQLLAAALRLSEDARAAFVAAARRQDAAPHAGAGTILDHHAHNLPGQLTPLLGRERDVAAVVRTLQQDGVRLLTLIGPAGVGKTRLALRAAEELLQEYADGVFFVALAPVRDPTLVTVTIAQTLRAAEAAERSLHESLVAHLRPKTLLLLLDNFEQVTAAAPLVAELLAVCPRLTILVTSRAPLRVRGEQEAAVAPLALPTLGRRLPVPELARYAAVQLFVQRARAVQPTFTLTPDTAPDVAAICIHLDGLPLAIELAATRIKLLPPAALLTRLEGAYGTTSLQVLADGAADLPERQRTLRDTLAWSYDLLAPDEQQLFRQLAVFAGGCTLEAAETVCGHNAGRDVLAGLASLLDKSLLWRTERVDGEPRIGMLETVREYALERLEASGEAADTRRRHAAFYLAAVERAEQGLTVPAPATVLARLETVLAQLDHERDNMLAALRWAIENGARAEAAARLKEWRALSGRSEVGMRLAGKLWRFWQVSSYLREGREWQWLDGGRAWLDTLLALSTDDEGAISAELRTMMLYGAGVLACWQGNHARAESLTRESLDHYTQLDDRRGMANALNNLGNIALDQAAYAHAIALFEQSLVLRRAAGDREGAAASLNNLAAVAAAQGNDERALALYEESAAVIRATDNTTMLAHVLANMDEVARRNV